MYNAQHKGKLDGGKVLLVWTHWFPPLHFMESGQQKTVFIPFSISLPTTGILGQVIPHGGELSGELQEE